MADPVGVEEGKTAATCPSVVPSIMAFTDVAPTVILMDVPPNTFGNGNELASTKLAGPRPLPISVKMDPWATPEFGKPAGTKLAAFTTPGLGEIMGFEKAAETSNIRARNKRVTIVLIG